MCLPQRAKIGGHENRSGGFAQILLVSEGDGANPAHRVCPVGLETDAEAQVLIIDLWVAVNTQDKRGFWSEFLASVTTDVLNHCKHIRMIVKVKPHLIFPPKLNGKGCERR